MRRLPFLLLPFFLLAGCVVGQLRDFVGPVSHTTTPQLLRFGMTLDQARCVGNKLGEPLRPRQLRMFARAMSGVHDGWFEPGRLTLRDLAYLAAHDPDPDFAPAFRQSVAACGITMPPPVAPTPPVATAAAEVPRGPTWLNLGAGGSGQAIAINAATIAQQGNQRSAWFRLTDPGATSSPDTFLLQIDCGHRTINAKARERHDEAGALLQHVDYPDNPLPVEGGTVMEIAWLSLCT